VAAPPAEMTCWGEKWSVSNSGKDLTDGCTHNARN